MYLMNGKTEEDEINSIYMMQEGHNQRFNQGLTKV